MRKKHPMIRKLLLDAAAAGLALMVFALILTSLSSTDLFPREFRKVIMVRYALKALPVTLIWFVEMWELLTHDYRRMAR